MKICRAASADYLLSTSLGQPTFIGSTSSLPCFHLLSEAYLYAATACVQNACHRTNHKGRGPKMPALAVALGVGLATSGNSGSVTDEARIGGENQFLIYGVQLGFLGMFLYILLLGFSISRSIQVFRQTENVMTARIAFTAAAAKRAECCLRGKTARASCALSCTFGGAE